MHFPLGKATALCFVLLGVFWLLVLATLLGGSDRHQQCSISAPKQAGGAISPARVILPRSDEVDRRLLFYNRVPKSGSSNLVHILKLLARKNNFIHRHSPLTDLKYRKISTRMQAHEVSSLRRDVRPLSYDRHLYFFDFRRFGGRNPVWFSMVREPTAKFESRFHYWRHSPRGARTMFGKLRERADPAVATDAKFDQWREKDAERCVFEEDPECHFQEKKAYDLTIPYFCGHADECRLHGSDWALSEAVRNVEEFYPVVGILEDLEGTLKLAENRIPLFFRGAVKHFNTSWKDFRTNKTKQPYKKLSEAARAKLSENLKHEVTFYKYLLQRFRRQLQELEDHKML